MKIMKQIENELNEAITALYTHGMTIDQLKKHAYYFLYCEYSGLFGEDAFFLAVEKAFPMQGAE